MMHKNREHSRQKIDTAEELARLLTEHSWCGCVGFEHAGHLYLNDATSGDGAFEVAIFKAQPDDAGNFEQIESITFVWCKYEEALKYIQEISSGEYREVYSRQPLKEHRTGSCYLCA